MYLNTWSPVSETEAGEEVYPGWKDVGGLVKMKIPIKPIFRFISPASKMLEVSQDMVLHTQNLSTWGRRVLNLMASWLHRKILSQANEKSHSNRANQTEHFQ